MALKLARLIRRTCSGSKPCPISLKESRAVLSAIEANLPGIGKLFRFALSEKGSIQKKKASSTLTAPLHIPDPKEHVDIAFRWCPIDKVLPRLEERVRTLDELVKLFVLQPFQELAAELAVFLVYLQLHHFCFLTV